ncbi:MAG TPA: hypothetical protein EYP65_06210 [Armatimonadetes bacterium]|nr:hypothetical protein [Armatimonadota bacterium]
MRASMPGNLRDFAKYVYEVVHHYRRRIRHYEVWNEPHYRGFFRGTPEDYVRLLETAYRAAKSADPNCVIVGGGGISLDALDWAERAFTAGLLRTTFSGSSAALRGLGNSCAATVGRSRSGTPRPPFTPPVSSTL